MLRLARSVEHPRLRKGKGAHSQLGTGKLTAPKLMLASHLQSLPPHVCEVKPRTAVARIPPRTI